MSQNDVLCVLWVEVKQNEEVMKQTTIIAMLASLLFSGVATACQHNVATIPAQEYAGNAFNTSAAPSPDTKDRKKQAGKDEVIDTREYQVKDFDHIDCGTIANIYFTQATRRAS